MYNHSKMLVKHRSKNICIFLTTMYLGGRWGREHRRALCLVRINHKYNKTVGSKKQATTGRAALVLPLHCYSNSKST